MTKWTKVPTRKFLTPVRREHSVEPEASYRLLGAHWYGEGLYTKEVKPGSEIRANKLYRVQKGDFVYNRLFAWKGSFAVATKENDSCFVSNEFPCFTINERSVVPQYLRWYFAREPAWDDALNLSMGATPTSRNRLKEEYFLELNIPLPPLLEQQRIVARIESLAAKIEEAKMLKNEITQDGGKLLLGTFYKLTSGANQKSISEIAPITRRPVNIDTDSSYPEIGIRSFGKGTFHKPQINGWEVGSKKLYRVQEGDLLFNNVFAWEGAIAVVQPEDKERVGSHRFIACVPKEEVVTANFLRFYFLTEEGLEKIGLASPGGAGRNRTLGLAKLEALSVPVPEYKKQLWFDKLQSKLEEKKKIQSHSALELKALLPSILDKAFKGEL